MLGLGTTQEQPFEAGVWLAIKMMLHVSSLFSHTLGHSMHMPSKAR